MSLLTSFLQAVKHTFEGNDGKISSRKTTAFLFVGLATIQSLSVNVMQWLIISKAVTITTDYPTRGMNVLFDFYCATLLMILLLFGIITWQQIQGFKWFAKTEVAKEENKPESEV